MDIPKYMPRGQSAKERLRCCSALGSNGCHEWQKYTNKKGYGVIKWRGRAVLVHRLSYEINVGAIPDEMDVLHECDNPKCTNPDHLFLGTNADNVADRVKKDRSRALRGEEHHSAKLTEAQILAIRNSSEGDRALAEKYGVWPGAIWYVRNGAWKHVK